MDFYLDINHGGVVGTIVEKLVIKINQFVRLILQVMTRVEEVVFFSSTEPEKMVKQFENFRVELSGK